MKQDKLSISSTIVTCNRIINYMCSFKLDRIKNLEKICVTEWLNKKSSKQI